MVAWHVNPATGEAGRCKAQYNCPFGGELNGHTSTKREAAKLYEDFMAGRSEPNGISQFYFLSDEDHEAFTQGDCGIFAEELHRQTGYPVVAVGVRGGRLGPETSWEHIAVRAPDGRILDVTGLQPESETKLAWGLKGKYEVILEEIPVSEIPERLGYEPGHRNFDEADAKATATTILKALEN
jgi:hypothetical protein